MSKLNQFVSVTGASVEVAKSLLHACDGNLDLAIEMYMEENGNTKSNAVNTADDDVRAPILPTRGVLVESETFPGRRRRKRNLPPTVFDPFRDVASEAQLLRSGAAGSKRAALSELFKPPLDLMFQGNFVEAKQAGTSRNRWLLVNIQDSREFSSQVLNRDVWSDKRVKSLVERSFVLWQVYRETEEATKFSQFYHVMSCPFVAMLDPRTGELVTNWRVAGVDSFIDFAKGFLSTHSFHSDTFPPQSKKSRLDKDIVDFSEEEQLRMAMAASMKVEVCSDSDDDLVLLDSDGEGNDDNDCIVSAPAEVSADSDTVLDSSRMAYLNMMKRQGHSLGEVTKDKGKSPVMDRGLPMQKLSIKETVSSDHVIQLLLRLPSGSRLECNFVQNHPLQELFDVITEQGYKMDSVEIVANYPRRVLTMVNSLQSFSDVGLRSRETLFIQTTNE